MTYTGLKPGMMVYVDSSVNSDDEDTNQCIPFNPFSLAFAHEKYCWVILMHTKGVDPQGLRPRRIYRNDKAFAIDTIEGLCGYPECVSHGVRSSGIVKACQTVIDVGSVEHVDYDDGEEVARYWIHGWQYGASSTTGVLSVFFDVPMEYILWEGYILQEFNPAVMSYTKSVTVTAHASSSGGSVTNNDPHFYYPPPSCVEHQLIALEAGRY